MTSAFAVGLASTLCVVLGDIYHCNISLGLPRGLEPLLVSSCLAPQCVLYGCLELPMQRHLPSGHSPEKTDHSLRHSGCEASSAVKEKSQSMYPSVYDCKSNQRGRKARYARLASGDNLYTRFKKVHRPYHYCQ